MASRSNAFSSEGFDLSAVPDAEGGNDVVFELGGSATVTPPPTEIPVSAAADQASSSNLVVVEEEEEEDTPISRSESLKEQGNEAFKSQNYLEACDMYGAAIEACPGITGKEILALHEEFEEQEQKKMLERNRLEAEQRRKEQLKSMEKKKQDGNEEDGEGKKTPPSTEDTEIPESLQPGEFQTPHHEYAHTLAIYHCNRAACKMHLGNYEDSLEDCDIAVFLRPDWAKAYVRRSAAYEKLEKTEQALSDAKTALEKDPTNPTIKKTVARLQKQEDERLEKLKEETMDKLKDLGNSLLSNFGLSLDNFQAKKDPNTGSYSISFDQGK